MLTLDSKYSLKRRGVLSVNDNQFLYNLYLPIIGYKSLFIYEFLVNEYYYGEKESYIHYLAKKSNLKVGEFLENKNNLESVGLLQTLEDGNNYVFILKTVLNPNDFFENNTLKNLFVSKVGKDNALKIIKKYEIDDIDFSKYIDISASVNESFEVKIDENFELDEEPNLICINKNEVKDGFDDTKLIEYIARKSNISIKEFTNEDIKEMHRLGCLYGLNEDIMGYIMIDAYKFDNPANHKVDYGYCNRRCKTEISKYKAYNQKKYSNKISSKTKNANLINHYETTSPRIFLKDKQNGVEPILADLNIIDYLSQNMGFSDGIINVILEYTLKNLDGKLLKNYVEKVAATMKRKGIKSTIEAYDYLLADKKPNTNSKKVTNGNYRVMTEKDKLESNDLDEISDEDIGDLL